MLVDELRHVEHRHLLLSVEHGLEVVVSIDHATLLGVLQIVLLDIHPQLLGDLGTRHRLATDDCGEFGRRRHRLHECGIRLTSYGLLGWSLLLGWCLLGGCLLGGCLLWRCLLRWGLLLGRALLLRWHTISCECGNSGRGASYSVECGAQWGKCYFSHENASFPPGQRDLCLNPPSAAVETALFRDTRAQHRSCYQLAERTATRPPTSTESGRSHHCTVTESPRIATMGSLAGMAGCEMITLCSKMCPMVCESASPTVFSSPFGSSYATTSLSPTPATETCDGWSPYATGTGE